MEDERSLRVVGRLYAAATADLDWHAALQGLLDATGFDGAALYVIDQASSSAPLEAPLPMRGVWQRLNDAVQDDYARHWIKLDPRAHHMVRYPGDRILHDHLHTPEAEMDRHPFYDWYFRTQDARYYLGGRSAPGLPFLCGLTLHRRRAPGPPSAAERTRFAALFDHVERAVAVEHRLFRAGLQRAGTEALAETSPTGILLLDGAGRIVHANPAIRAMAAAADAFSLGPGLHALGRANQAPLGTLLCAVLGGTAPDPVRLARRTGRRDYLVLAVPVARGPGLFRDWAAAACVLVVDPDATPALPEAGLRRVFGLTQAEARLLAALAAGYTVDRAADALGVAITTARSQLAAVFRKTGTSRQAELVRLVASIPWVVNGDGTR